MVAQSGGEVNRLLDRRLVEGLPAIDAPHGDLVWSNNSNALNYRRLRTGRARLNLPVRGF